MGTRRKVLAVSVAWAALGAVAWLALIGVCEARICGLALGLPSMVIAAASSVLHVQPLLRPLMFRVVDGFPELTTAGLVLLYVGPLIVVVWRQRRAP